MEIEKIAEIAHELNRSYCNSIGDNSQVSWKDAPQWQKDSAINGVKFVIANPDSTPESTHDNWLKEKLAAGWTYGNTKDAERKEHPCCVPYNELPLEQKVKDTLFRTIVTLLK